MTREHLSTSAPTLAIATMSTILKVASRQARAFTGTELQRISSEAAAMSTRDYSS